MNLLEVIVDAEGHYWNHDPDTCPIELGLEEVAEEVADVSLCDYSDDDMYCVLPLGHKQWHLGYPHDGNHQAT